MQNKLPYQERKSLLKELKSERQRKNADRIRIILLLDDGWTYKKIAEAFFIDEDTVANYKNRYLSGGLESLLNDAFKGSPMRLSLEQQILLELHLLEHIYIKATDIIEYIKRRFKVVYSVSGLTALLKRMEFSYKKPKSMPCKANLDNQLAFINEYSALKELGKVYFGDSVHPHHNPILAYGWIKKGLEADVLTNSGRGRLNIAGAISLYGEDIITQDFATINSESICVMLELIKKNNPQEKNLFYVLDNAGYHRSKAVKLRAQELGIQLVYLPSYSPNLNPIERFWKFFKQKVLYNYYYPQFDDFKKSVLKFFKNSSQYKTDLQTIITDNFRTIGI